MRHFYESAIKDEHIGPFFIHELGDDMEDEDWEEHIELLADFWLAKMLGHDTYYGNFVGAHVKMPRIQKEHFTIWLELFSLSADSVYTPEIAQRFKKVANIFTQQFLTTNKKI